MPPAAPEVQCKIIMEGMMNVCEANAYLRVPGKEEQLLLEAVDRVYPWEDGLMLEDIFCRQKVVRAAKIVELSLVNHRIILEKDVREDAAD